MGDQRPGHPERILSGEAAWAGFRGSREAISRTGPMARPRQAVLRRQTAAELVARGVDSGGAAESENPASRKGTDGCLFFKLPRVLWRRLCLLLRPRVDRIDVARLSPVDGTLALDFAGGDPGCALRRAGAGT